MKLLMLTLIAGYWTAGGSYVENGWKGWYLPYEEGDSVYERISSKTPCYMTIAQIPEAVFDTSWPAAQMVVVEDWLEKGYKTPVIMRYRLIPRPGCLNRKGETWGWRGYPLKELEDYMSYMLGEDCPEHPEEWLLRHGYQELLRYWGRPNSPAFTWNLGMLMQEFLNYGCDLYPRSTPYKRYHLRWGFPYPQDTLP